ncbi:MAG: metallophosphoesterase family protein [Planctomycetota bacterium]|nr:MAG: metallophosphoesterase family protein [Planctomycetota bacterium]
MKRTVISAILIITILCGVIAAIIISQDKGPAVSYSGGIKPFISRGPYLQFAGHFQNTGTMVAAWETSTPQPTSFVVYRKGSKKALVSKISKGGRTTRHKVLLPDLTPDTEYKFACRKIAGHETNSSGIEFRTPKPPGSAQEFVVYGDSRYQPKEHAKVSKAILKEKPAFIIHTGDFVSDGRISSQWDTEWFRPAKEMLKSIPVLPVLGNHEYNAAEYYRIFDYATMKSGITSVSELLKPKGSPDYTRIIGDVEIIVIDTNRNFISGDRSRNIPISANYAWLKEKLEAPRKAKWRIVCMHNPAFSSGMHGSSDNVFYVLVPLFNKYKPDIVFCGHDHCYERSEYKGITYITTAGGGAPLYKKTKKNPFSKCFKAAYHYTLVETDGDKMTITAKKPDGTVLDSTTITKK